MTDPPQAPMMKLSVDGNFRRFVSVLEHAISYKK